MKPSPYLLPGSGPSTATTPARSGHQRLPASSRASSTPSCTIFPTSDHKPHKSIALILKGKPFIRPDISAALQGLLEGKERDASLVVDVGASVGMATFSTAAMGFRAVAFEPVI